MTRVTPRPKEEPPAAPAALPLAWRVALAVWAAAFGSLVVYELAGFIWNAVTGLF